MQRVMRYLAVFLVLVLLAGCGDSKAGSGSGSGTGSGAAAKDPIKLGAIFDLTGGTADVGVPHSEGVKAYFDYLNSKGGIGGRKVELTSTDYGYGVDKAVDWYKKLVTQEKVVAIIGWGTGDTEAMKGLVAEDQKPFISGSFAESLTNPGTTPYNFIVSSTYSQQARILLDWVKGKKADAKVALVYNDTAFGKAPLADAKAYAQKIGLNWVGEVVVALNATDATTQVMDLKSKGAEYVLIQETTNATAVTLKSAKQQGLLGSMQFMGLAYSTDEGLIRAAGDAAEGFVGVPAFFFPYEKGKGIEEALEYAKSKGIAQEKLNQKWLQGWAFGRIMSEALAKSGNDLSGPNIRKSFESLKEYDLGGLGAPLSFSDKDHGGAKKGRIYQVKGGKWEMIVDLTAPKG